MKGSAAGLPLQRGPLLFAAIFAAAALAIAAMLGFGLLGGYDGGLSPKELWFLWSALAGFALSALIAAAGAEFTGMLTALLFLGLAAGLWMTRPAWFPSLRLTPADPEDAVLAGFLVLQAFGSALALWIAGRGGFGRRLPAQGLPGRAALAALGPMRLGTLAVLTGVFAVSVMGYLGAGDFGGYLSHLLAGAAVSFVLLANLAAILAAPDLGRLTRYWSPGSEAAGPRLAAALARIERHLGLILGLVTAAVCSLIAWRAFGGAAQVEDEVAYLFQARVFSRGALMAPPLPAGIAESFHYYLLEPGSRGWYSVTAPGWPAALTLGILAGMPILVNPALGGLAVWLGHALTRRTVGPARATLVAVLMAGSPWLHGTSASLMTHALSLALTLGAWLMLVLAEAGMRAGTPRGAQGRARDRRNRIVLPLAAGAAMGWLFLTRPLEGLVIGGLTGVWTLWAFARRGDWAPVLAYGAGCVLIGGLIFPYDAAIVGDPLLTPQAEYLTRLWGPHGNAFGFGPDIGAPSGWGTLDLAPGHSPAEAALNALNALHSLGFELFGWATGSLVLFWAALIWGGLTRFDRLMLALALAIVGVHFFYWFNAAFYIGPRYWYGAFFPVVLISAAGAEAIAGRLVAAGFAQARPRMVATVVIAALAGTLVFSSWRAVEKYALRSETGRLVHHISHSPDFHGALYFVEEGAVADAAMMLTDPWQRRDRPVVALDLGPEANAKVIAAYPGRRVIHLRAAVN